MLILTLAACGGGGSDSEAADPAAELGPLDEYFQQMYGGGDAASNEQMMADSNAQMLRVEESVAACMRDEGFEYIPVDQSGATSFMPDDLGVEWGTLEFAKEYGYGATTDPGGMQAAAEASSSEDTFVDPNSDYVSAMSETEQQAYYAALYGEQATMDSSADPDAAIEYNWETAGCQGAAQHEVYEGGMEADAFASLQDDMTAMYEAVGADPRLAELNTAWASCMSDAGIDGMAAVGDGETSIYDEVNAVQEAAYAGLDGTGEEMTEESAAAMEEAMAAKQDEVEAKLAEITPREISTAVADYECRAEVEYDEVSQEVNIELQQEFVDSHKAELDAWLAATLDAKS